MAKRIVAAFEEINKTAQTDRSEITKYYLELRLAEPRLAQGIQVQKQAEREIECAKHEAEKEEIRRGRALEQAREEAARAVGEAKAEFDAKVKELEANLAEAQSKVRAVSMAKLTTTGHQYVLSHSGSFGDGM